jgi:hypothetical protein
MKKILILTFFALLAITPKMTSAYTLLGGHYDENDTIRYYIDTSVLDKGYGGYAIHGATAWNSNPNIEVIGRTSNESQAQFRFFYQSKDTGDYADCGNYNYTSSGWVLDMDSEYDKSVITFYKAFDGLSDARKKETAAHEVGHAWGLDHEDDVRCIMYTTKWADSIWPLADDHNGINAIY